MTRHRVKRNEFRLANGSTVNIEYWTDAKTVSVAAFDTNGRQATVATYQGAVDTADDLSPQIQASLIDSLANTLEYDLINKPELLIRTR